MHAPKTLGDVSVLKGLSLGASGAGGLQQRSARVENRSLEFRSVVLNCRIFCSEHEIVSRPLQTT